MAWGGAAAGGALLANDIGAWLIDSHHEAVTKDLLIMANQQMRGALFETDAQGNSRVKLAALEKDGALNFLLSEDFYTSIDRDHREALTFVRENLSIAVLKDVARDVRITAEDAASSRATVIATYRAVSGNKQYLEDLLKGQERHAAAFKGLAASSSDALKQLTLLNAASMQILTPRQKLALQEHGILVLTAAEKASYENTVLVEDIASAGQKFSAALNGISQLPGLSPKAVTKINKANRLVSVGISCATAYLTGDPMSYMSAIGGIAGMLGGGGGPSAEVQMLQQVLQRLDEIEKKIDQYHKEEMLALDQINANLFQVQDALLREMQETQLLVLDNSRAIGELLADDIKACDTLLRRYGLAVKGLARIDQNAFSAFFESDLPTYGSYFQQCRDGIGRRLLPSVSSIFTPLFPTNVGDNVVGDNKKARLFVQTTLEPTLRFYDRYGLANETVRRNLMGHVTSLAELPELLARVPPPSRSLPPADARLAIQEGGYRMLDAREVINTSAAARTVLEMVPSFYQTATGLRPITRQVVEACAGRARADCPILPGTEAGHQLADFEQLLALLLLQENLVSGLPAAIQVSDALDGDLTEALPIFGFAEKAIKQRQDKFTYPTMESAHVKDGDLKKPHCHTGQLTLDAVCVMQANPLLAQNAITYLVSRRIGTQPDRQRAYAAALEWEGPEPLQALLGPDVLLHNAALDFPDSPEGIELRRKPHWAMLLPRAYAYVSGEDEQVTDAPPTSCWEDPQANVLRLSKKRAAAKLPIADRRYMRCYLLPPARSVATQQVVTRPFVDDAELERRSVAATIKAITTAGAGLATDQSISTRAQ